MAAFGCVPEDRTPQKHQSLSSRLSSQLKDVVTSSVCKDVSRHAVSKMVTFAALEQIEDAVDASFTGGRASVAAVDSKLVITASDTPQRATKRRLADADAVSDVDTVVRRLDAPADVKRQVANYVHATSELRGRNNEQAQSGVAMRIKTVGTERHVEVATLLAGGVDVSLRNLVAATRALDGLVLVRVGGVKDPEHGSFISSSQVVATCDLSEILLVTHFKIE